MQDAITPLDPIIPSLARAQENVIPLEIVITSLDTNKNITYSALKRRQQVEKMIYSRGEERAHNLDYFLVPFLLVVVIAAFGVHLHTYTARWLEKNVYSIFVVQLEITFCSQNLSPPFKQVL